ncbi:MAG: HlyD family efflux transporter periplasmic adaptor subunit, partial [Chloroflexota bacterium]
HPLSGDRVSSGQTAFQVDDVSELMGDLQISEVDINNVIVRQPVTISMDAIPNMVYSGVVSKVNQTAKAGQGGINFLVSIKLTDADELVKPGMSASVTITVKEVASALLVPNKAVRMMNGQRFVYVLKDKQAVPVNIRIGTSADETSQVVGGDLKEGDLIILNPPSIASATPGA